MNSGTATVSKNLYGTIFPETQFVKFSRRQDRLLFFSAVNELVKPDDVVLDYGAGRNRFPEFGAHLNMISTFRGRCARIIGVDVDPVVMDNDALDEAHVLGSDGRIPLRDASVDVIFSYAVFEHLVDVGKVADELYRVLKPGGWLCAWTPNKWGYVGLGARLTPNALHARLLNIAQPHSRVAKDVFPVAYQVNTLRDVRKHFPDDRFDNHAFYYNAQPSYNFGSAAMARLWLVYMALTPDFLAQSLMIFLRKNSATTPATL